MHMIAQDAKLLRTFGSGEARFLAMFADQRVGVVHGAAIGKKRGWQLHSVPGPLVARSL
jgi:hypothetical protein